MSLRTERDFYSGWTMPTENIIMQNIMMRILSQHQPYATTEESFNTPNLSPCPTSQFNATCIVNIQIMKNNTAKAAIR